ncbi:unnamed protein product [Polarella glacialis]|uniref:DUF4116 domain-containing protein n=1 Tax=Polarella glacialis TaxID=89957 RepID=A0A813E6K1_POLGL|nr:unnamed protein product [Polarella glacialis]
MAPSMDAAPKTSDAAPKIRVVCGLTGLELCEVEPSSAWKLPNLIAAVSVATTIPGRAMRLLLGSSPMKPGALPAQMVAANASVRLRLVRVDPHWGAHKLEEVLEELVADPGGGPKLSLGTADRAIALAAVQHSGAMLFRCSEELLHDKELVLAAVRENGRNLTFAPEALQRDREVVLAAVRSDGETLSLVRKEFQDDREVVEAALEEDGEAIRHASIVLRQDRAMLLAAIQRTAAAFRHVPTLLQRDKAFCVAAARVNGDALHYAPQDIRSDKDFALAVQAYWAGKGDAQPHPSTSMRRAGTHLTKDKAPPQRSY